jgi:glucose/arabinose dehydrogenase/plastocyanin
VAGSRALPPLIQGELEMKRTVPFFLALAVYLCAFLSARAATVTINISNFAFDPPSQTIQAGDTVRWVNMDLSTHTSTSGGPGVPDGNWNSGFLSQNQSFSQTFTTAGTFPYYCAVHTFMTGTITVQAAQTLSVDITSPANNASFAAPGSVTIEATANSSNPITKVEFFDQTTLLDTDTSSPFSITANLAAGTHSLTAKVTDSTGATAVSSTVTVTVGGGGTKISDPIPAKIQKGNITIELQTVLEGLVSPLGLAVPDDGSGRMFLYDQVGLIHVLTNGAKMDTPLLDVQSRLVPLNPGYDERGLLGVATHPNFAAHPFVYTYTSEPNGPMADFMIMYDSPDITNNCQSVIAEWRIDPANTNRLDPSSRREILRIDKPQSNHNGGTMRFGPDGFLYFSIGDGGAADDQGNGHLPSGNAQSKTRILGKVVRIDVDGRNSANGQYGIPTDNPFVNEIGSLPEIYAYGLRNPYSFTFDKQTGDLLLGDVGQNDVEEADKIIKGGNFGWHIKEGTFYFDPNGTNNGFVTTAPVTEVPPDLIEPFTEYDHDEGEAIIGGYMYRGSAIAELAGKYVFGDWGLFTSPAGRLFYFDGVDMKELKIGATDRPFGLWLKGWGQDAAGELYAFGSTNLGPTGTSGKMLKLISASVTPKQNSFVQTNLVSDIPGMAPITDTNLVNPWGIAFGPTTPFWISDNHAGLSTLYNSTGAIQALVVTIPPPAGAQPPSAPTGALFNNTTGFMVSGAPARFIFASEDGTITAWNSGNTAVLEVDNSGSDTIYKGLALASSGANNYLYAADFHNAKIDVFDSNFAPATLAGSFSDPTIPAGFAPFDIQAIGGNLYVTYAKQDDQKEDDVPVSATVSSTSSTRQEIS